MLKRRQLIASFAAAASAACVPRDDLTLTPVWLRVSPDGAGYRLYVDDEEVELAGLEEVLLDHAITANPHLTREAAREQVRIYVRAEPGVTSVWIDDLMPVLNRFGKVGIVAEDRRR